ncbi:MAG: hypothetical protein VYE22_14910 [Myxococcota bacterium]|nr:hypothetical protein [Myxococcota bacterium]
MYRAISILLAGLVLGPAADAAACTCASPSVAVAVRDAALVAEVQLVEVQEAGQRLRFRVDRVFASRIDVEEGEHVWVQHVECNSVPYTGAAVGSRSIVFVGLRLGALVHGYCDLRLPAWQPIPGPLLEARRRWLRERGR